MKVRATWATIGSLVTLGALRVLVRSIGRDFSRAAAAKSTGMNLPIPPPPPSQPSWWSRAKAGLIWEGTARIESPRRSS